MEETTDSKTILGKTGSKIFRQNRALGYISNHVPAKIRYVLRRKDTLIITCIGRSFQVFTASHMRMLHVSPLHPDEITVLAADRLYIYTACEHNIYAWRAGKHIRHIYRGHTGAIHTILPFGPHLVSVDDNNVLKVWQINTGEVYLDVPFNKDEFLITVVAHPPTYLNKVVLGSQQGLLKIWNLKDNRLIYTFQGYANKVTCIEPSPALDVVAVGYNDGVIILLNLKFDEELMRFKQDWGCVAHISFRTDGVPFMATSSTNGYINFWNLEERKVAGQVQAHFAAVTTVICFPNEPLLLTTSPDNSMKLWIFDMPDNGARLLRVREGHTAPPLCIRYHGNSGVTILSAGEDSTLRSFSTLSESLSRSMGHASYNRKASKKKRGFEEDTLRMPPIIEFTTETTREKEWDDIAAIHAGIVQTTTWSFNKNRMGEHRLVPEKYQKKNQSDFLTESTCLTLTQCGNFVIIGYSNGDIARFNIQSGIERATYGDPTAHKSAVRGLACDNLNQFVISGCSEGLLKFWPFKTNVEKCIGVIKFNYGISLMRYHRESAMISIALDSFMVYIVDTDTKAIIRKFAGHTAKINDMTFSSDSRWLLTAAMDATIKVWDVPSSYMIDHFQVERPCISLSMSPTGDFLATAHVGYLGVYLWANKTLFNHISLCSIDPFSEAPKVCLPSNSIMEENMDNLISKMEDITVDAINAKYISPIQLSKELVTLSGLPTSRWQNLLDLETIKKRNKPKTQLKIPKQAPFFLPTVAGHDIKFDLSVNGTENDKSNNLLPTVFDNLTIFGKMLEETSQNGDYEKCVIFLKNLGPTMIDFEIKSLLPIANGPCLAAVQFLKTIEYMFLSNINFELAQSYLSVFLRAHNLKLLEFPELINILQSVSTTQENCWKKLENNLIFGMGVVSSLRNFV